MFRSVGAVIFGIASDRYGRKWPFIINNILFIILELVSLSVQTTIVSTPPQCHSRQRHVQVWVTTPPSRAAPMQDRRRLLGLVHWRRIGQMQWCVATRLFCAE
jgi:MFS family permease